MLLLGGLWLLTATLGTSSNQTGASQSTPVAPAAPQPKFAYRGEEGHLSSGADTTLVATTDEAWDALFKAISAKDKLGLAELVMSGKVFVVESGTKVLVIDRGFTSSKVRVLEGKHLGKAGWVPFEFVKP